MRNGTQLTSCTKGRVMTSAVSSGSRHGVVNNPWIIVKNLSGLATVAVMVMSLYSCGANPAPPPPQAPAMAMAHAMANDSERAFLQAMVPHHELAITMARQAGQQAKNPVIKSMAATIIRTQGEEIATMRTIHRRLFGSELEPDAMAHGRLGLTLAESGMNMDMAMPGPADDFDRMFAEHMTRHHQGAINMARKVLEKTNDGEIRTLAEAIIAAQTREIGILATIH